MRGRRRRCRHLGGVSKYSYHKFCIECLCTGDGKQLVSNVDGRLVLVFVHSILPPFFQQLLHRTHALNDGVRTCSPSV